MNAVVIQYAEMLGVMMTMTMTWVFTMQRREPYSECRTHQYWQDNVSREPKAGSQSRKQGYEQR